MKRDNAEECPWNVYLLFGWIALYGCINMKTIGKSMQMSACMESIYMLGFVWWIRFSGQSSQIWMKRIHIRDWKSCVCFIPIFFLPICNLVFNGMGVSSISAVIYILDVVIVEEVLFRGFLLRFFLKSGRKSALLFSAFVFGVFHFVNLVQNGDWSYVFFQSMCAFVVGIYYNEITLKYDSLLIGIVAHFLVNVTGMQGVWRKTDWGVMAGYVICMMLYIVIEIILYRKINVIKIKGEERKDGILY